LDDVKNNRATALRDMTIKVFNAADCSPTASVDRTITIPHTRNACNRYNENATSARFFKIRCNAGEQYNSIRAANKYLFKDYSSESACMSDGIDPIGGGLSLLSVGSCQPLPGGSGTIQMYYTATCSNSNANPHTVRFFSDAACKTASTNAAPIVDGTPAGTLAALEYSCVSLSATTSISAGARNEYVYGIGSVLLWTNNGNCQGIFNGDPAHPVYNFYPNDGECVKPTTNPPNEFSAGALGNDASKSWRFFLNQNSQACRGGVTTMGMITNGKIFGGEMYGLCVNGFADWGYSLFRMGSENLCNAV